MKGTSVRTVLHTYHQQQTQFMSLKCGYFNATECIGAKEDPWGIIGHCSSLNQARDEMRP